MFLCVAVRKCKEIQLQGTKHKQYREKERFFLFKKSRTLSKEEASSLYRGMKSQSFFKKLCKAFIPPYTCMEGSKQKSSWLKRSGGKPAEIGGVPAINNGRQWHTDGRQGFISGQQGQGHGRQCTTGSTLKGPSQGPKMRQQGYKVRETRTGDIPPRQSSAGRAIEPVVGCTYKHN